MNMQNSIDDARQQLVQLDIEWEDLAIHGDSELLARQKDHLLEQIRLWEFLRDRASKEPNLCVYPKVQKDGLKCDALMITAGGIYLYHLLPSDVKTIQIQWPTIQATHRFDHSMWEIGRSKTLIFDIMNRFGLTDVAIYEVYITPPSFHQRYTFDGVLILSFQQLRELFTNLVFRENYLYGQQEVLRNYLTEQRGTDEHLSERDMSNKEPTDSYANEAFLTVENDRKNAEKEPAIAEVFSASEQAAPATEEPRPLNTVAENKIPPRRRKETKKQQSWIARLFKQK